MPFMSQNIYTRTTYHPFGVRLYVTNDDPYNQYFSTFFLYLSHYESILLIDAW